MRVVPKCPRCGSEMVQSVELATVVQDVEQIEIEEDGPEVYEWGDSDVWYESSTLQGYACRSCMFESDDLSVFVPDGKEE